MELQYEIAHTDGDKVDTLIRLKNYQLFGARSHVNVENQIYVTQAIQTHEGLMIKRTYLIHVLDIALDVVVTPSLFRELAFGRGIPQPSSTNTAFGVMLWWGLQSIVSVLQGIRAISMYDLVCYVTFVNVPPRKGSAGHREYFVKVFNMGLLSETKRHEDYKIALGFLGQSEGIHSYSLGIHTIRYSGLGDFHAGRPNLGLDKKVAYTFIDSVPANVSMSSIVSFFMVEPANAQFVTKPDGTLKIKMGLLFPVPNGGGECRVYLIWEGPPVGDLRLQGLRLALSTIGGTGLKATCHPSMRELQHWVTKNRVVGPQRPLSVPSVATSTQWLDSKIQLQSPITAWGLQRSISNQGLPRVSNSTTDRVITSRQSQLQPRTPPQDMEQQMEIYVQRSIVPLIQVAVAQATQLLHGTIAVLSTRLETVEKDTTEKVVMLQQNVTDTVRVVGDIQGQLEAAALENRQTQRKLDNIISFLMDKGSPNTSASTSSTSPALTEASNSERANV